MSSDPSRKRSSLVQGLRSIIGKEVIHIRRDPVTLVVTLIIPVFQLTIFGYAIQTEIEDVPTAVLDLDRTQESRRLVTTFVNTTLFAVKIEVGGDKALYDAVVGGVAKVGLKIPHGYAADRLYGRPTSVLILVDGSDPSIANQTRNVAAAVGLHESVRSVSARSGLSESLVDVRSRMLFNPDLRSANFYVPGLVGVIMQLVTVLLTAFAVVRERERGTLEQLLVTPIPRPALMLGKLLPYAVIGFTEFALALLTMRLVFRVPIAGSLPLLLLLALPFLFAALGIGILISTLARNQAQALQFSFLVLLPSILLSGFVFPRDSMPPVIFALSFLIPVTYFIEILRGIVIRGAGLSSLWQEGLTLLGFGVVLMMVSTARFRRRLT
jgi:ABC transporter DrrB family efflux protein